jgi:hypothetical protein
MILIVFFLWAAMLCCGVAWAFDSPGLSLNIYVEPGAGEALEYGLDVDPVKLFLVLKNESGRAIVTERNFSLEELHHSLIITDPNGARHILRPSDEIHKMPMPFFINEKAWSPAEKLPVNWVKSTSIEDLRAKVPVMFSTAGWYTIEAQQPFVRFASSGEFGSLGTMAMQDNANNWTGALVANKLQILIAPLKGAQLKVQVIETQNGSTNPVGQVPVRVYYSSDSGDANFNPALDLNNDQTINQNDLATFAEAFGRSGPTGSILGDVDLDGDLDGKDLSALSASFGSSGSNPLAVWSNSQPVLVGTSNFDGWTVWESDVACIKENNYLVIASYGGQYRQIPIAEGVETGWGLACTNFISKKINFGDAFPTLEGDLNGDGCVDLTDYQILMDELSNPTPHDPKYDLNNDGNVDIADARYLVILFTNPQGAPCP